MDVSNNLLLHRLVGSHDGEDATKTALKTALEQMGVTSVFDIVRMSKAQFAQEVATYCDANAEQAYDNAQSHARRISRLYLEHQLSSSDAKPRVRRSLDSGPTSEPISYQGLFQENWDQFCKDGDIAAIDSPVAYPRGRGVLPQGSEGTPVQDVGPSNGPVRHPGLPKAEPHGNTSGYS